MKLRKMKKEKISGDIMDAPTLTHQIIEKMNGLCVFIDREFKCRDYDIVLRLQKQTYEDLKKGMVEFLVNEVFLEDEKSFELIYRFGNSNVKIIAKNDG